MTDDFDDLRDTVGDLPDDAVDELIVFSTLCRGAALKPTTSPSGQEMLFPDPDYTLADPMPEEQSEFWNALTVVLVTERDRRAKDTL